MDPIQTVKAKDSRTLMVNFSLMTGATHYIIRVQNANGFFREDTVYSSLAEIQSLAPYTEYTLSIMAVNGGGRSQPSLPVTAKTSRIVCHFSEKNNTQGLILVTHSLRTSSHHSSWLAEVTWSALLSYNRGYSEWIYTDITKSNPVSVFVQTPEYRDPSGPLLISAVTVPDNFASNTMAQPRHVNITLTSHLPSYPRGWNLIPVNEKTFSPQLLFCSRFV